MIVELKHMKSICRMIAELKHRFTFDIVFIEE